MEKPWRVVSNADGVDEQYATMAQAVEEAGKVLDLWRQEAHDEGEWGEDVEFVEVHLVTHAARIVSRDGENEDDGVEYGITEILGNEIDEQMRQLRAERCTMTASLEWAVCRLYDTELITSSRACELLGGMKMLDFRELYVKWQMSV